MSNGNESRILKPGIEPPMGGMVMDVGINPESVAIFQRTMREMRESVEGVLRIVEEALAKAKELEAVKNALSDG